MSWIRTKQDSCVLLVIQAFFDVFDLDTVTGLNITVLHNMI